MIEVRWHGRGGQGAVTSAELVAHAAIGEGKYAQSFPSFGPERRGAPVAAFLRISDDPIKVRAAIYDPDIVVVLDPRLLKVVEVTSGLKPEGRLVLNTKRSLKEVKSQFSTYKVAVVDAARIARETLGLPITNTVMIGALLKAENLVEISSLASPLEVRFGKAASRNIEALRKAYEQTEVGGLS